MASPTIKKVKHRKGRRFLPLPLHLALPLVSRRCVAVLLEVSLVTASGLIPYSIGLYANQHYHSELVPLNPVLSSTEKAIAQTLAYPLRDKQSRRVAPLTNLFWCAALVMPLGIGGWQLYLLGKTGKTKPKAWLGIQVVTASGAPPGLIRAVWRETVGRYSFPVGVAYLLWRYTGAFPDLSILLGLAGLLLLAECASSLFNPRRRTLHDRLSGTYVLDYPQTYLPDQSQFKTWQPLKTQQSVELGEQQVEGSVFHRGEWFPETVTNGHKPQQTINTIVITPQQRSSNNLWLWMRRYPGLTLLITALVCVGSLLGTFVGTQIYIQSQANRREFKQQKNEVFLTLVKQLSSTSATALEERQGAILALARLDDPRAVPFLVDLLGQERTPALIDTVEQAMVSSGPEALPYLQHLNQALQNDQKVLSRKGDSWELRLVTLRQRATSRAIAKIITIYPDQIHHADLSRTNLGQVSSGSAIFTLVLDNLDLSGINFRSAILSGASLRGSRFYGMGEDRRFGTFDDWITDLSGADLKEADLTGAILKQVSMNRTNLLRATLNRADLSESLLLGANLSSAKLIGASLRQAVLEDASLTGADLGEATLTLANLRGASLGRVIAVGGDFSFADLTKSSWEGADLSRANLQEAQLQEANLSSTKLVGANLRNAQLKNTKLTNSNLSSADLRGANLAGADFLGVSFATDAPVGSNQFLEIPASAESAAKVRGVDFSRVKNLDVKQIKFICTHGGRHSQCP
ncbi:MAG: pentapeptide repeat-containing protein [Coleofasciculaceae cyanobacterium]